jgi:hypothetical protein
MDPAFDKYGIPAEILKLRPPTSPAQGAARWKADLALQDKYPGQYVAYVDNWTGDELDRVVVAFATGVREFHRRFDELPADVRERVSTSLVPDPDEGLFIGGCEIDFSDEGDDFFRAVRNESN